MLHDRRFLAIVPARGGSKSVPRKNVRPLAGRPLLHYTLDQIAAVPEIDRAVVSTDNAEIAAVARAGGGEVLDRPSDLATDEALTEWALLHAIDRLEVRGQRIRLRHRPRAHVAVPHAGNDPPLHVEDRGERRSVAHDGNRNTSDDRRSRERSFSTPGSGRSPSRRQDREPFYVESSTVYVARVDFLRQRGAWLPKTGRRKSFPRRRRLISTHRRIFSLQKP